MKLFYREGDEETDLWLRIRGQPSTGVAVYDCYRPPNKEEEDEALSGHLKKASQSENPPLVDNYNPPDFCWMVNTNKYKPSRLMDMIIFYASDQLSD